MSVAVHSVLTLRVYLTIFQTLLIQKNHNVCLTIIFNDSKLGHLLGFLRAFLLGFSNSVYHNKCNNHFCLLIVLNSPSTYCSLSLLLIVKTSHDKNLHVSKPLSLQGELYPDFHGNHSFIPSPTQSLGIQIKPNADFILLPKASLSSQFKIQTL